MLIGTAQFSSFFLVVMLEDFFNPTIYFCFMNPVSLGSMKTIVVVNHNPVENKRNTILKFYEIVNLLQTISYQNHVSVSNNSSLEYLGAHFNSLSCPLEWQPLPKAQL